MHCIARAHYDAPAHHSLFQSKYPSSLTSQSRATTALAHASTSSALGPAVSPRWSSNRSISSSCVILKAPEPGEDPLTMPSISPSDGRPNLRNIPQVESDAAVIFDRDAGVSLSFGRSAWCGDLASKNLEMMFFCSTAGSEMEDGDHSGRSFVLETRTAVTPVMKSSVARLDPCSVSELHYKLRIALQRSPWPWPCLRYERYPVQS